MNPTLEELLQNFQVDPHFGFVLPKPLQKLPPQFQPWHDIADNIPQLIANNELGKKVLDLPVISVAELETDVELRLAHLILTTLAAAYVWENGREKPRLSLPKQIGLPLMMVSQKVGLPPIICHASACLANWKFKPNKTEFKAENIELIAFKFMNHVGNHWFFTLTAQMETEFAPAILAIARACYTQTVEDETFKAIRKSLAAVITTINRMSENLPPAVFYHGFRSYLSGYTEGKLRDQGGIKMDGLENVSPQLWNGGSAAQSSTLHVIDGFLQIHHSDDELDFLIKQRDYMPREHRKFIQWVEEQSRLIPGITESAEYKETVGILKKFRDEHIKVVVRYIVLQANPGAQNIGTGGTSFMKLLKNIRNNC